MPGRVVAGATLKGTIPKLPNSPPRAPEISMLRDLGMYTNVVAKDATRQASGQEQAGTGPPRVME